MLGDLNLDWQIVGLTLQIVGIFFIVNSLTFKKPRRFLLEHFGVERSRPLSSIRDHVLSMVQLLVGFVFMIAGLFLQIGYHLSQAIEERANFFSDPGVLTIAAILIGSMLVVALILKVIQILWTKWTFKRLLTDFFREHAWALEKDPQVAKQAGEILGVRHRKEDSVAEYLERLKAFLEIDKADKEPPRESASRPPRPAGSAPLSTHPATPPRIMS